MTTELTVPKNLREAILYYSNETTCRVLLESLRFPNGLCCVHCGEAEAGKVRFMESVQRYKCYSCRKQFSIKAGTVLEDSPISLTKWFPAFWLLTSAKNGISSYELHRALGVTQKSAWFMLHRIRYVLETGKFEKLTGTCEADETYIGGKEANKHASKRRSKGRGGDPGVGKSIVAAVLERSEGIGRTSKVRTAMITSTSSKVLQGLVKSNVEVGATVYTDAHMAYRGLSAEFVHEFVDHAVQYARGSVSTNGLENYFSLLKRTLRGTYVAVEPFHLTRYMDEQAYRFNTRDLNDSERFVLALAKVAGRRLTYDELTTACVEYFEQAIP